jgi:hypothetical protein
MTTNSLKNGSHVIVREGDTPFYLWSSTYYSSPLGVKHAQVRCIKDEAEVMEAEGICQPDAQIPCAPSLVAPLIEADQV